MRVRANSSRTGLLFRTGPAAPHSSLPSGNAGQFTMWIISRTRG
jgi:hypothetical protein